MQPHDWPDEGGVSPERHLATAAAKGPANNLRGAKDMRAGPQPAPPSPETHAKVRNLLRANSIADHLEVDLKDLVHNPRI